MNETSMDDLPEPIIQHILSFLTEEEAAQTTLLSKSWRNAWLTRTNLAFEEGFYCNYNVWELATKTIQRYQDSNLKIQSLTLRARRGYFGDEEIDIFNELIAKTLRLGATHLNLNIPSFSPSLIRYCSGLESLCLNSTPISLDTLSNILSSSSCPSFKKLSLSSVEVVEENTSVVFRCPGLESLCLDSTPISLGTLSNILSSSCPSIRTLSLSNVEKQGVNKSVVGLGQINLGSLTRLELVYVYFDTLFLDDLSSRFPSLTDFTLHRFSNNSSSSKGNNKVIRISSRSLLRLNFAQTRNHRGKRVLYKFDVPRLRLFTYQGNEISDIPLLSIKTASREWESRVSIVRRRNLATSWFRELSEFLTKLRRSKLHVSLGFEGRWACFDYEVGEIEGLSSSSSRRARVENLTVELREVANMNCYALFDGLFQVCRPKVITQYLRPLHCYAGRKVNSTFFLCKAFLAREGGHFLYRGLGDLEEVNAEVLDEGVWRHVPLKSLLDIRWDTDEEQARFRFEQKIRFQLKWKKRKTHGSAHLSF